MLLAGIAWGLYSLRGRGATSPLRANADNFARCVPLALLALASGGAASGVGYAAWYAALRGLGASTAAVVQLVVPPLAALGGVLLLGELADARLVAAGATILGGVALVVTARHR